VTLLDTIVQPTIFISGLLAVAGGLVVFARAPRQEASRAFLVYSLALALLAAGMLRTGDGVMWASVAWVNLPVLSWWTASTFGRHAHRGVRARLIMVLGLTGLSAVFFYLGGQPFPANETIDGSTWGRWAALAGVGLNMAAAVNFLLTMRGAVGRPRLRRATGLAAFASLLPLWPNTVTTATGELVPGMLWPALAVASLTVLAMALWFVRYRPKEGDIEFGQPVAYVSYAAFLLGIYLLLVGGVGKVVEWAGGDLRAFLSALGGVLLAVLGLALASSGRVWDRIRRFVDRNIYRGEFDFRSEWMRISEELAELPDPRDLGATLCQTLSDRLRAPVVLLYRRTEDDRLELWARRGDVSAVPDYLETKADWLNWLWRLGAPAEWGSFEAEDMPTELVRQTRLAVPLIAKQEIVAVACLGGRSDSFTAEERLWLEAAGQQAALAVLASNLTERLIETRELASYNRLSTFVIHDVKNAVSMISLLLQNLEERGSEVSAEALQSTLAQATAKLTGLIERFSSATPVEVVSRQSFDLAEMVRQLADKAHQSFPGIQFDCRLEDTLVAQGDREQIARVLENLYINACEAMQGKGRIEVHGAPDDGGVALHIRDQGSGMDVEFIRDRLFHPFATTKKKGLGIGLYQSREIARAHGGRLTATSRPGEGATFTLWLPIPTRSGEPHG